MGKQLKPLNFSESILSDYNNFHFYIKSEKPYNENNPMIEAIRFEWNWNNYSGYGIIYLKNGKIVMEDCMCKSSNMTVESSSKRQVSNGRCECALYNDSGLKILFERIIAQNSR